MDSNLNVKTTSAVSFKFSKLSQKQVVLPSVVGEVDLHSDLETEQSVTTVENNEVIGVGSKTEATVRSELLIPLLSTNDWRSRLSQSTCASTSSISNVISEDSLDAETRAAKESLLHEAISFKERRNRTELSIDSVELSASSNELSRSDTNFASEVDVDYAAVPIEEYGKAMLRGMGWKDEKTSDKLGLKAEPSVRPKGLGLGADFKLVGQVKAGPSSGNQQENKGDELQMKKGAFLKILSGHYKDSYAKIEGFDEDNARLFVKLAIGGNILTISQCLVQLVSQNQYERDSKILNKVKYDSYKEKADRELSRLSSDAAAVDSCERSLDAANGIANHKHSSKRKSETFLRPDDPKKVKSSATLDRQDVRWVQTDLRVRIVDKSYANGKYYKAKVRLIDVSGYDSCICKTDDGKILDCLPQSSLETVVPKEQNAFVKVISGKYKNQIGRIIQQDKQSYKASIQLFEQNDKIIVADFDHICEYVGECEFCDE